MEPREARRHGDMGCVRLGDVSAMWGDPTSPWSSPGVRPSTTLKALVLWPVRNPLAMNADVVEVHTLRDSSAELNDGIRRHGGRVQSSKMRPVPSSVWPTPVHHSWMMWSKRKRSKRHPSGGLWLTGGVLGDARDFAEQTLRDREEDSGSYWSHLAILSLTKI